MEQRQEGEKDAHAIINTTHFYGVNSASRLHRNRLVEVAKRVEYIKTHPLPSPFQPGILGPPATWRVFKRQAEAIKYSQLFGEGLMVFSFEGEAIGGGGKRGFVVTHPSQMWVRQRERLPERRCVYEVIQEQAVCKLYFDLEFLHAHNPSKDGVAMTNTLIGTVCYFLQREFSISASRRDVIDLAGTSDLKFSRHLIFNMPGVAFATNGHVGAFVRMVCNKLKVWRDGREQIEVPNIPLQSIKDLFVLDSKGSEVLFCDEAVYSRNRNFRLFLSTKFGQNYPLIVAEENEYLPNTGPAGCDDKQIFFDSLITLVDNQCRILSYKDTEQLPQEHKHINSGKTNTDSAMEGMRQSPFPEIDGFIQSIIGPGSIHSWHYFSQSEVIVYNIVRYRFCLNIGREHKSNNIMYVVSVKDASYHQKCHDPDCRDFRSPSWPLPKETVFWHGMKEAEVMEWIQSIEEEVEEEEDTSAADKVNTASEDELETLLVEAADAVEKWYHLDELISSQGSCSIKSSQGNSQSSNPWDRLSQLSSPSGSQPNSLEVRQQDREPENHTAAGLSDKELLEAVHLTEELLQCVASEMEITC